MPPINNNVTLRFGAVLVGCCIDIFLQGVLSVQFNLYFNLYRGDRLLTKVAVAGLALFTTLKSIQSFVMLWVEFIDSFADSQAAYAKMLTHWSIQGNAVMVSALGSYIRAYFCYRLFSISMTWWPVVLVATLDFISFCLILAATYLAPHQTRWHNQALLLYSLHFTLVFAGDMLLTLLTAFFLTRSKKGLLPRTHGTINRLIWLTFQTAAPGAICSLTNLIVSQLAVYGLFAATNEILPKLYAFSMMWTLNARQELRDLPWGNHSTLPYITNSSQLGTLTKGPVRPIETMRNEEFELRPLDNRIRTHTDGQADDHVAIENRSIQNL